MNGPDRRFFQSLKRVFQRGRDEALLVEFRAQLQFQFACRFVCEGHRGDLIDCCFSLGKYFDDAANQCGGFAGASRRLDDQAFVERSANALARRLVGFQMRYWVHAIPRISINGSRRSSCLFFFAERNSS